MWAGAEYFDFHMFLYLFNVEHSPIVRGEYNIWLNIFSPVATLLFIYYSLSRLLLEKSSVFLSPFIVINQRC